MREIITTVLELVGGLAVIIGVTLWVAAAALPLALVVAGILLVAYSWLLTNPTALAAAAAELAARRRGKRSREEDGW